MEFFKRKVTRVKRLMGRHIPVSMQLEVTNHCNFKCIMCPTHRSGSTVTRNRGFMKLSRYEDIIRQFAVLGGRFLIPQGAGESFLHPEIFPMLDMAQNIYHLDVGLNTNGSTLSTNDLDRILEIQPRDIGFSIDALTEETFTHITGKTDLTAIEEKVRYLVSARKRRGQRFPVIRVLIVEQAANSDEIEGFINKWLDIADAVVVQTERVSLGRRLATPRRESRVACRHLFDTLFIQWDGDVTICCEDWESQVIIGNAFSTPLNDIWFSPQMNTFRAAQKNGAFSPPSICSDCEAWQGAAPKVSTTARYRVETTELTRTYSRKN